VSGLREVLAGGGVALLPTDTVYGLAAALDVPAGVDALYALKGRPRDQPCQVLLYSPDLLAEALAPLDTRTRAGAEALLPGPATCIVPDPSGRYGAAAGSQAGSVGVRAPRMAGAPAGLDMALVATSANEPGEPDPARLDQVPARLRTAVAAALDAGPLPGTASAVVDLRPVGEGGAAAVLRPGPDPDAVVRALGAAGVAVVRP
jgi:L-threonylcarbamoyladenylate synthase